MAARGITGPVRIWACHDQNICLRHRLWTGGGVIMPADQADLTGHPDILRAQVRHSRLIRRYDPRLVRVAYQAARDLYDDFTYRGWRNPYLEARDLRLTARFQGRPWQVSHSDPIHHAVNYPEVISLTALLASPHWRPFALSTSRADRDRFHLEFWRQIPASYPRARPELRVPAPRLPRRPVVAAHDPQRTCSPVSAGPAPPAPGQSGHRPSQLQPRYPSWPPFPD
jgi:hypothetical protein